MANIKKRPNGQWRARYRDATGKEHARHFARKVDGLNWLAEQTASLASGTYVDPRAGKVPFRAYAETWRTSSAHAPATRALVERSLTRHVYPVIGDLPLASIRLSTLQGLVTTLAGQLAPATVKLTHGYVAAVFRAAVRDRLIGFSPCDGVRLPSDRRAKEVTIPPLPVVAKLAGALPPRFAVVAELVAASGLRQGELFGLELDGVNFLRRELVVRQQLVTLAPDVYLGPPKTAESVRTIPLARSTVDALAAHLRTHPARVITIEDRTDPNRPFVRNAELLFTRDGRRGVERVTGHGGSEVWRPAARVAGLAPRTGIHCLRHVYASLLIRHGESVMSVQRRLGHSSAVTTLNVYGHLWDDADDRTRDAVTAAFAALADPVRTAHELG